ncbi:hypothetical protein BDB00DRAFT_130436 [Zychaea mexicana]|uniref:uncharacterized protein n=1 Tax=Zychaea mexicana TaxID=64656 RepID=UPI0022FEA43C|nr:uncharacterized protein BDB00DRAFT_130436 [Zychaea mexicana]KAI9484568.1 hypothetical protein BDB00DRAFT_130436 [Zychaea mexicana]
MVYDGSDFSFFFANRSLYGARHQGSIFFTYFLRAYFINLYSIPADTLIYVGPGYDITLYAPDPLTGHLVPISRIPFLHLSSVLNCYVIRRVVHENTIRTYLLPNRVSIFPK